MANKNIALHWFLVFKASDNCCDGRTYAQVLAAQFTSQTCIQPIHENNSTRIVANRQKNANASQVTPSKVGIKICSNAKLNKFILQKMKTCFHWKIDLKLCNNFLTMGDTFTLLMPGKMRQKLHKPNLHL